MAPDTESAAPANIQAIVLGNRAYQKILPYALDGPPKIASCNCSKDIRALPRHPLKTNVIKSINIAPQKYNFILYFFISFPL
jgi:hypothetical protein